MCISDPFSESEQKEPLTISSAVLLLEFAQGHGNVGFPALGVR